MGFEQIIAWQTTDKKVENFADFEFLIGSGGSGESLDLLGKGMKIREEVYLEYLRNEGLDITVNAFGMGI